MIIFKNIEKSQNIYLQKSISEIFWYRETTIANKFISHLLKRRNQEGNKGEKISAVSEDILTNFMHFIISLKERK